MPEGSSRNKAPSRHSRTMYVNERVPQGDDGADSEDISMTDLHRGPAAALATLNDCAWELEESLELMPMGDTRPEDHGIPPGQSSSQRQDSPGSTVSWTVLLVTGRTRNFERHIAKHWPKYTFLASLIVFIGLIYPALTFYRWLWQANSQAAQPTRPSNTPNWRPWRERKGDDGLPRILLWNKTGLHNWWVVQKVACVTEDEHPVTCDIIQDRQQLMSSDAVVFLAEHFEPLGMPHLRSLFQFWVFWAKSHSLPRGVGAHGNSSSFLSRVADTFNWTMANRDDADIVISYDAWRCDSDKSAKQPSGTVITKKRKDVAWIVGKCEQHRFFEQVLWSREQNSIKSSTHDMIGITLFPACGKDKCSSPRECIPRIAKDYHFVLVSLKSDCFQSAYELLYDAFKYSVVPVVLAPSNATLQVPEKSVVISSELQKPGELAAHLRDLLKESTSYESYFAWKQNCSLTHSEGELCPLCRALWAAPPNYRHRHPDVQEWWSKGLECVNESLYGLDKWFRPKL
ncbi:alpha-(1,3)-fucosyltransferase fut-3-like [Dermacentor variabilis]|uniref:alpha-(1,3)-fucosyltransferase fut-3-like n=1 Tax=Dermacentor variabilis TaxID=34621 RepID=UPI003F5AFADF